MILMRSAGIREARQHLSTLLEHVRRGREVVITDRGQPVARLVPVEHLSKRPFSSHRRLRARVHLKEKPLSETIGRDREDRF